jgi:hypothetical protein
VNHWQPLAASRHFAHSSDAVPAGAFPQPARGQRPPPSLPWATQRSAFLASSLGTGPDAARAAQLAGSHLLPSTYSQYASSWRRLTDYCALRGFCPLPALTTTVVQFVAYLSTPGNSNLKPQSLQPVLSAINKAHTDVGLVGPATGDLLHQVRRGWSLAVHRHGDQIDQRAALPARIAERAMDNAIALLRSLNSHFSATLLPRLRSYVYVAFGFSLMARVDTDLHLQRRDVELTISTVFVRLRQEKGRAVAAMRRRLQLPRAAVAGLYDLLRGWQYCQAHAYAVAQRTMSDNVSFWRLPSDVGAWTSSAAVADPWLQAVCVWLQEAPPEGDAWSTHSLRIGAASATNAIDVNLLKIKDWGGWALASGAVHGYIRPIMACQSCFRFFGWMTRPVDFANLPRPQSR